MSDTRKQIAERHAQEWLARWGSAPPNSAIEVAMSEYAAALLEEVKAEFRNKITVKPGYLVDFIDWLEARAAQERER